MIQRVLITCVAGVLLIINALHIQSAKPEASDQKLVKVEISRLLVDQEVGGVILVLKPVVEGKPLDDALSKKVLALVIGVEEARSISVSFFKVRVPRPLSHDLMKEIIEEYGGTVSRCIITKMEKETFFAELYLNRGGEEVMLDSRPSDAIALSLRTGCPIYVSQSVMIKNGIDLTNPDKREQLPKA